MTTVRNASKDTSEPRGYSSDGVCRSEWRFWPRTGLRGRSVMKRSLTSILLLISFVVPGGSQTANSPSIPISRESTSHKIPDYLAYGYFLRWAPSLRAAQSDESLELAYALPFQHHAGLRDVDVQLITAEAVKLGSELKADEEKVAVIRKEFRDSLKTALTSGKPAPAVPLDISLLQARKNSLLAQHYWRLQKELNPEARSNLQAYIKGQFAPHISLRPISNELK